MGYGLQENDDKEECEEFFTDLAIEVKNAINCNEYPVVLGDMNAKISEPGECEVVESEEITAVTRNGKIMIKQLIEMCNMEVLNFTKKCSGKWTREARTTGSRSVLDYVLVSDSSKVKQMVIDEPGIICPFRITSTKKEERNCILSDHNAITTELEMSYKKEKRIEKQQEMKKWITNKEGWDQVEEVTKKMCESEMCTEMMIHKSKNNAPGPI